MGARERVSAEGVSPYVDKGNDVTLPPARNIRASNGEQTSDSLAALSTLLLNDGSEF